MIRVREFAIADYDQVAEVWSEAGLEFRPGDELEGIRAKLRRDPELFLVAEERGRVVGTAMGAWDGRRGWIYHLGVRPGYQRREVGTRLVREVEARMRRKGVRKVNALIYPSNGPSIGFFSKNGYSVSEMVEAQKYLDEGGVGERGRRGEERKGRPPSGAPGRPRGRAPPT
ncbi:MAG: GNAT family N-acetyltransferase [Nitrososphaerales archaeon]